MQSRPESEITGVIPITNNMIELRPCREGFRVKIENRQIKNSYPLVINLFFELKFYSQVLKVF